MSQSSSPTTPDVQIRAARPDDTALILSLIRELADFEKLSHEVVADEATLSGYLFGERPYAEVVIAEVEGQGVGFALFFHNFSTFLGRPGIYLEDLYVRPAARGHGLGQRLLAHLAKLAVERGCGRLEWCVLDWNEGAIRFYRRLGAVSMDEWTTFRLSGDALQQVADTAEA
jgi:GNAT superfamily N-acetyltransferase